MTIDELLESARQENPHLTFTKNKKETAVAFWQDGQWSTVAGLGIDGKWYSMGDLLVNGEPVHKQEDWLCVDHKHDEKES